MNEQPRIAFLGTGLMGAPMARGLCRAGFCVHVWNRSADKAQNLQSEGAQACDTIAEAVGNAQIIVTMLSGQSAIEDVIFGSNGVASAADAASLIIDMSSLAPNLAREHHNKLSDMNFRYLDAPVSGGVAGAKAGTLSIMVGGALDDFEHARIIFDAMGKAHHLGAAGAGQVCKMVNQTIVHTYIGAVTEGLLLAEAMGVPAERVRDAISGGFCQSRILDLHGLRMVERDFVPGGPLEFSVKDLEVAKSLSAKAGLTLPLTNEVLQSYSTLVDAGSGGLDHSALLLHYETQNPPHRVSPQTLDKRPDL